MMIDKQDDKQQSNKLNLKKYFTFSNFSNLVLLVLLAIFVFSADAKGVVMEGLMKIGLFQPDIPQSESALPIITPAAVIQDVEFLDNNGQPIKLSDQKGKVVFINFWAAWCPPCIAEMPTIDQLHAKYKNNKDVLFLMVDVDGKIVESTAFMNKKGFDLPVHVPGSGLPKELFAGSMPTTVMLDKSGNIVFHHVGGADYSNPEITGFINKLLN
ncbi:TlpA family protein disulfide reductase [Pedobacter immunditicola]|uniref:TlpA family protein disulfide reductase n=1 Tax=Pedobacter immunditicola TaxID=3133440 RepID=UPI0030A02343